MRSLLIISYDIDLICRTVTDYKGEMQHLEVFLSIINYKYAESMILPLG